MLNESETVETEEIAEEETEDDAPQPETKPEKAPETPEAKLARLKRQAAQLEKKLGVKSEEETSSTKKEPSDLDYGQKAYLTATLQIKGSDEWALVREYVSAGKSIDDLIDNRHFNNDLKDLREAKASADAVPSGTKRVAGQARDAVEHWVAKGGLPPNDGTEATRKLRQDIVNARMRSQTSGSPFTDMPIVK